MGVIYQIWIDGGSRTYVGSAHNLTYRKRSHLSLLRKGTHHCRALQNAVKKYGFDAISWIVLEEVDDRTSLIEREQAWLDSMKGKLYNKSPTAGSRLGAKMSVEARAKISASLMGNQYRKGIPFSAEERDRIAQIVKLEYATGKRTPNLSPENLSAYNAALKRGDRTHPRVDPDRDAHIAAHFRTTKSQKATGREFGITGWAVTHALRRHERRAST